MDNAFASKQVFSHGQDFVFATPEGLNFGGALRFQILGLGWKIAMERLQGYLPQT